MSSTFIPFSYFAEKNVIIPYSPAYNICTTFFHCVHILVLNYGPLISITDNVKKISFVFYEKGLLEYENSF